MIICTQKNINLHILQGTNVVEYHPLPRLWREWTTAESLNGRKSNYHFTPCGKIEYECYTTRCLFLMDLESKGCLFDRMGRVHRNVGQTTFGVLLFDHCTFRSKDVGCRPETIWSNLIVSSFAQISFHILIFFWNCMHSSVTRNALEYVRNLIFTSQMTLPAQPTYSVYLQCDMDTRDRNW